LASRSKPYNLDQEVPTKGPGLTSSITRRATQSLGAWRSDGAARWLFIWPAVLLIFGLSVFPLIAAVALSVSKLAFTQGNINLDFVGAFNYNQLLFGTERVHFL
jgi:ABC-type sugar transport system permease subunit